MISTNTTKVTYKGDGQTTVFPFSFPFNSTDYVHVAIYDTETKEITYPTKDYIVDEVAHTVTYPGYAKGQEIKESERPAVLDSKKRITIFRLTDIDQLVDLGEKYPLQTIEGISDKITEILQELKEQLSRAILVKLGSGEDPQKVYDNIWDYAKRKAEMAFDEPNVTAKIEKAIDEAVAAAQKELAVLDANDILGKVDTLFDETAGLKETTDSITATVKENKTTQDGENEKLASQIKQNADSITATVAKNKADTDKAISEVKQTADGISSTVAQNKKDADTAISKVDQKADSINATVQANKTSTDTAISNVNQRADSITTTVQEQKEQFDGKIGGLSSQITQNANSITSVVTNLKDTDKAKAAGYSSITQLQDEVNLRVKTSDYNGKNIVNQINLNSGGVVIDGSRVHITGDTKIDKDLIVAGNIKAGSITLDNLSQDTVNALSQVIVIQGDDRKKCTFRTPYKSTPIIQKITSVLPAMSYSYFLVDKTDETHKLNVRYHTDPTDATNKGFTLNAREYIPEGETFGIYSSRGGDSRTTQISGDWNYTAIADGANIKVTVYADLKFNGGNDFNLRANWTQLSITVNGETKSGWSQQEKNSDNGNQSRAPLYIYITDTITLDSVKKGDKITITYKYARAWCDVMELSITLQGWVNGNSELVTRTGYSTYETFNTAEEMYTLS